MYTREGGRALDISTVRLFPVIRLYETMNGMSTLFCLIQKIKQRINELCTVGGGGGGAFQIVYCKIVKLH